MTAGKPGTDQREEHLASLRDELARHGVRCALDDRGVWPRLRIYCPGEGATAEFDNNVVAAPIVGRWFFFWPGAEPIGPVTGVADAAGRIIDDLCLDGDDGTGMSFTSLAVRRMLQHAQAGIPSPGPPGSPPGGGAAARHQLPRPSRSAVPRLGTWPAGPPPGQRGAAARAAAGEHAEDKAPCRVVHIPAAGPGGSRRAGRTPWRG
jgi:hypothetical protein